MIMSRISMNVLHPSARQALRDRNDMHRNLSIAIGENFIYRVFDCRNKIEILVISENVPDEAELSKRGYGLISFRDMTPLKTLYKEGSVFAFDLLASPAKKIKREGSKNDKRVFLKTPEERKNWLTRQGEKYGFEILSDVESAEKPSFLVNRNSGTFWFTGVKFEGFLRVTDANLFWKAWEEGIGPEKAYGMGLLVVRR